MLDGADVGGADFEEENGAEVCGDEFGEDAFVLPKVGEVFAEGDGGNGVEGAVEDAWGSRGSGGGEVEAVVVDGAEAGEDEGAVSVFGGEFGGAEKGGEVEVLAFDEDGVDGGSFGEAEVASVGGEDDRGGIDGAGFGAEAAAEKIVKGGEFVGRFREFGGIEAEFFDERSDSIAAGGGVHSLAVEAGKAGPFNEEVQEGLAGQGFVGSTKPSFAIDGLGFELAAVSVEIVNRVHGERLPLAWRG